MKKNYMRSSIRKHQCIFCLDTEPLPEYLLQNQMQGSISVSKFLLLALCVLVTQGKVQPWCGSMNIQC